jgi:YVTN family beta-propeller protein
VYEAPDTAVGAIAGYRRIAADDSAPVVSTSWVSCEALNAGASAAEQSIFAEMVAQGQTVFAASGDAGSEACLANGFDQVPTGKNPVAVAAVPGTGTVYVADQGSSQVTVESEKRFAPVATVTVGPAPDAVTADATTRSVYVADDTSPGTLSVLAGGSCDAGTQADCSATTIAGLGNGPSALSVDAATGTVYVANAGSGTVSVVSAAGAAVVGTVTLPPGSAPTGVAVDPATHHVYVADSGSGAVSVIDGAGCDASTQTGCPTPPATIALGVGSAPEALAVDDATGTVDVVEHGTGALAVIATATGTVTATIPGLSAGPGGVAFAPGGQILVADRGGVRPALAVVAPAANAPTAFLAVGDTPGAVAADPVTGYVFTTDGGPSGFLAVSPVLLSVDDPAGQPDVTGVGGTDLTALTGAAGGTGPTESAWGDSVDATSTTQRGAGGGGISAAFAMPASQSSVVGPESSGVPCGASSGDCREVPDVSASAAFAHGYVVYDSTDEPHGGSGSTWMSFGGTSAAAPLWAALAALAVAHNGTPTGQRLGDINPDLYQLAAAGRPDFNDITTGDNDFTTTNGGDYAAGPGYDMATGLGSPVAAALVDDLNPLYSAPVVTTDPVDQTVVAGQETSLSAAASGTPAPTVQWKVSNDGGYAYSPIAGATADTYSFRPTAADDGDSYEAVFTNPVSSVPSAPATLTVVPFAITTASPLPGATRGVPYSVQLTANESATPVVWRWSGRHPKGLSLSGGGLIAGTPTTHVPPGTYTLTVRAATSVTRRGPSMSATATLTLSLS